MSKRKIPYKELKPYYDKVISNETSCSEIALKLKLTLGYVLQYFSVYLVELQHNIREEKRRIKVIFLKPDNIIEVYSVENKIMFDLSGEYTDKLIEQIKDLADEETIWHGF